MQGYLLLVRGLPGSGKSTWAKLTKYVHIETDMLCMDNGKYVYKPEKHSERHLSCQRIVQALLDQGVNVVVSNTFTTLKELEPYIHMHYAHLNVVRLNNNYGSIHHVPEQVIKKMTERFEDYLGEQVLLSAGDV